MCFSIYISDCSVSLCQTLIFCHTVAPIFDLTSTEVERLYIYNLQMMNSSEDQAVQPDQFVMATKWLIEGVFLPAIGAVGIIGR